MRNKWKGGLTVAEPQEHIQHIESQACEGWGHGPCFGWFIVCRFPSFLKVHLNQGPVDGRRWISTPPLKFKVFAIQIV